MEQGSPQPEAVKQVAKTNVFTEVTLLSKLLAMVLFIALPFIGGWIGYTYAPEKVVEVEKIVEVEPEPEPILNEEQQVSTGTVGEVREIFYSTSGNVYIESYVCADHDAFGRSYEQFCYRLRSVDGNSQQQQMVIDDLTALYQSQFDPKKKLSYPNMYKDGNSLFFTTSIPGSSACCGIARFEFDTLQLKENKYGYCASCGEVQSITGQYIAKLDEVESGDGYLETVYIVDVYLDAVVKEETLGVHETVQSPCSYAGAYDFEWLDDHTLEYGVYDSNSYEDGDECTLTFIEKRQISIP